MCNAAAFPRRPIHLRAGGFFGISPSSASIGYCLTATVRSCSTPRPSHPGRFSTAHPAVVFAKSVDLDQSPSFVLGARLGPSFPSPRYSASPCPSPALVYRVIFGHLVEIWPVGFSQLERLPSSIGPHHNFVSQIQRIHPRHKLNLVYLFLVTISIDHLS